MTQSAAAETIIAAVDVGSNSIKLTVARVEADGAIVPLHEETETVRLGAGVSERGRLAGDRIEAALAVLRRFAERAKALGASRLIGAATEAVRRAANGQVFLDRIVSETGWNVRLISGDEEAALTFRGLATAMDLRGRWVIADIGGGSTELIVAQDGAIKSAQSLTLGSGTLTERFVIADPPTAAELSRCQAAAHDILQPISLVDAEPSRLIALGGTGEYLRRLVPAGQALDRPAIETVLQRLTAIDAATLAEMIAIQPARARVLPAGIAVVLALTELVHPAAVTTGPSGIRLGLIAEQPSPRSLRDRPSSNFRGG